MEKLILFFEYIYNHKIKHGITSSVISSKDLKEHHFKSKVITAFKKEFIKSNRNCSILLGERYLLAYTIDELLHKDSLNKVTGNRTTVFIVYTKIAKDFTKRMIARVDVPTLTNNKYLLKQQAKEIFFELRKLNKTHSRIDNDMVIYLSDELLGV